MSGAASFATLKRGAPFALLIAVAAMAAAQWRVPYLNELATHVIDAARIWRGEIDCTAVYRLPLGYAGFIAPFIVAFGEAIGVKAANLLAFALCAVAALAYASSFAGQSAEPARRWLGLTSPQLAGGLALLALTAYPYMIFNVARTTEAVPAAALIVAFLWVALQRPTLALALFAGLCIGFGMQVRANMISMLLPAALWLVLRADGGWLRRARLGAAGLAALAIAYGGTSLLLTGCGWYSPTNGGYNLYAGNNSLSAAYLKADQNAEYSIIPSLREKGVILPDVPAAYQVPQADYVARAKAYARDCPSCVVKLAVQKAAVYFSPRLKNAGGAAEIAVQWVMAGLTWLALALALLRFMRLRTYGEAMMLTAFAAYALPFILTNADPRLRFPLDIVALCYLAVVAAGWLAARATRSERSVVQS